MAKGHTIEVKQGTQKVTVTIGGETVAESTRPLLVFETGLPVRYYLPPEDVRTDLLAPTDTQTTCPFKGVAAYWSYTGPGERRDDVVWGYPEPIDSVAQIKDHLCFYDSVATVTVAD
ncbi:DUF427 domain-containing protein [Actinokineospora pegani]|uniref:DUF427 domain-containing protein n=1 Tax=Actinokineospora pegani TaxID=2654637 RepID=UPI0012EA3FEC|nr:DUF427 domain-containing protein [Actinokineospora pegani]